MMFTLHSELNNNACEGGADGDITYRVGPGRAYCEHLVNFCHKTAPAATFMGCGGHVIIF